MCRALLVGGVGGLLVACGKPTVAPSPPRELVVTLSAPPPAFEAAALSRRWRASDIFQYEVSLRRGDGSGVMEPDPLVVLVLPQKGAIRHEARFTNLRAGARYRVDVLAKGNVGGTAPDRRLNSETPAAITFDLRDGPDGESVRRERLSVTLDPVAFDGMLTLRPRNVPAFVKTFTVDLREVSSARTRYAGTFKSSQTMRLSNLRVGIGYQVRLSAYRANGRLHKTLSSELVRFDPTALALEQHRTLEFTF